MKRKISPSVMCVDFFELDKYIKTFEQQNIELLHIDIMDGSFVPNYTLGTDFIKALKQKTNIPLDVHLMINNPENKLDWFDFGENDYVSVHYESTPHIHKALVTIKKTGAKAMVALNPGTPINVIENLLDDIDAVLVMTVNPGFAGQQMVNSAIKKIKSLREYLDKQGYENIEIEVDGNVSFENAKHMAEAGANIFVAGSSSVFSKKSTINENTDKLRKILIENEESEIKMDTELWYAKSNHIPVLGHRGICSKFPENTLVSFEAAINLGVDLIEFDVNITKDGIPVVIHDNDISRTSDHKGLTRDYTLEELKSFDFGIHFDKRFQGTQIPTLREVLTLAAKSDTLLLNVEIKDMTCEAVDKTIAMIQEFNLTERCVIACFDAKIIRYTKKAYPYIRTQGFPGRYMKNFTEETYDCMFGMGIPIYWEDCSDETIKQDVSFAKSRGILAWLFCADTEEGVRRCVDYGCDNITGNNPEIALNTLRKIGLHK